MSYALRSNPAASNHYDQGRGGKKIDKIVIHHAATTDFDGIGATFRSSRFVSAHYGVGRNNNVDQYVAEGNTAWHCGNYPANQTSIGIENVNSSSAPDWNIADETFNTLVELVRDIADRNGLGRLVVGQNLFGHRNFSATACPGQLYARLTELADRANGTTGGGVPAPTPPRKSDEAIAGEVIAGAWGNGDIRRHKLEAAGYNAQAIQAIVNRRIGQGNPAANAPIPARASNETIADQIIAGAWGNGPDRKAKLQNLGYDYNAIQAIVNRKLGAGSVAPARKSNDQIANEVLLGSWGNGPERKNRITAAGYDYSAVQALVNRKLGF